MKKAFLLVILAAVAIAAGCSGSTSKSYTWDVSTGDMVKIKLDTTGGGWDITSDVPFTITKDGYVVADGTFMEAGQYEAYKEMLVSDSSGDIEILDEGKKGSNKYIRYSYKGQEFNTIVLVSGSNTALVMGNTVSADSAREAFERMEISEDSVK